MNETIINQVFSSIISAIDKVLYYPFFQSDNYQNCITKNLGQSLDNCGFQGIPFLVLWIFCAGVFLTFRLKFVNIRLFIHGVKVIFGKYASQKDPGEISTWAAMATAIASTVGVGNIAGVAVAISLGGPGAVLWMVIMGFFSMSINFTEITLAQKYRVIEEDKTFFGGPFRYLKYGLQDINLPKLGVGLALIFAVCCLFGGIGVSMFQANQATKVITGNISFLHNNDNIVAIIIAIITSTVLIGGIKRVSVAAEMMVPFMALLYLICCIVILTVNAHAIPAAMSLIFHSAFDISALNGGMVGAFIVGVKRAIFANEAGLGTSAIAHSTAKTAFPIRHASATCLTPFLDTILICFITGLVLITSGAYKVEGLEGIASTSFAFATINSWFPYLLVVIVFLFAYSTLIAYGYYGSIAWIYIFGKKSIKIYYTIYSLFLCLCGNLIKFDTIIAIADSLTLAMCIPNLLGLYLLHNMVKKESEIYVGKLKSGEFEKK